MTQRSMGQRISVCAVLAVGCVCTFILARGHCAACGEELPQKNPWHVSYADGEVLQVSQCGFNIAVLALELFGRKYDPEIVLSAMRPTTQGILFSDLCNLLRSSGLQVFPRQHVRLQTLVETLEPHQLVILSIGGRSGGYHYIACVRDRNGQVLVLDPPNEVVSLSRGLDGRLHDAYDDLVVAFVSGTSDGATPLAERIDLAPDPVELETFDAGNKEREPLAQGTLELSNRTPIPIMVARVGKSCGCTDVDWMGGVVPAGGRQIIPFTVDTRAWGVGRHSENIFLEFADGSERVIPVIGTGMVAGQAAGALFHHSLTIEVPSSDCVAPFRAEHSSSVTFSERRADELDLKSSAAWLRAAAASEGRSAPVHLMLNLDLNEAQLREISAIGTRLQGEVQISDNRARSLTLVNVYVKRRPAITVHPRTVTLSSRNPGETGRLVLTECENDSSRVQIDRVYSKSDDLLLKWSKAGEGSYIIECTVTEGMATNRYHTCYCEVKCGDALPEVHTFIVHVE